jgi:flagellar protein FliS
MSHPRLSLYQDVDAATADPGRRLLMLLGGAEQRLGRARTALAAGDAAGFAATMARTHAILGVLADALDEDAGEAPRNLARLYHWALRHLTQGLAQKSVRHIDEVLVVLREIRDGFEGAVAAVRRGSG